MAANDEETFLVLEGMMRSFQGGVWAKFQIQEEKRKRKIGKQKGQSPTRWLQTSLEKVAPAGKTSAETLLRISE